MGLGMGATMMPLFTTALKTLTNQEVARGSTLLNITQQIASSVGVAVISVMLTSQLKASDLALPAIAAQQDPAIAEQIGGAAGVAQGLVEAAGGVRRAPTGWRSSSSWSRWCRCSSCRAGARSATCSTTSMFRRSIVP